MSQPMVMERDGAHGRAALLSVGTRFWSEGLSSTCRVTAIDERMLEFETLDGDLALRTSVPFELVAKHVTAGRWRLLDGCERAEEGCDAVSRRLAQALRSQVDR